MTVSYLLKPAVLARKPEIAITEQEYLDAKRCHKQVYEAFEVELAFDFVVTNYIEVEKYIAEHLVLDMVGQLEAEDALRMQQWGFIRTVNSWLASISFWHDLTRNRLTSVCGRGSERNAFEIASDTLQHEEFVTAFLFYLRDYSQHGGFPLTHSSTGGMWNDERTERTFSAEYMLHYDYIRPYFEQTRKGSKARKAFGKRIVSYSNGRPFDLKPIIRQSLSFFGKFMDEARALMSGHVLANEAFVLDLIERYQSAHPEVSIMALSVMPVDANGVVANKVDIIPVRDEPIRRAREMRRKNNGKTLASIDKRLISNR